MESWASIRLMARGVRDSVAGTDEWDVSSALDAAVRASGLEAIAVDAGMGLGPQTLGLLERGRILYLSSQGVGERLLTIAHELGHFHLHRDPRLADVVGTDFLTGVGLPSPGEPYAPDGIKEGQADLFAAEFLCPVPWLRERLRGGDTVDAIVERTGLGRVLVERQAASAIVATPDDLAPIGDDDDHALDQLQSSAATSAFASVIVEGAPGTGKTRTLVARVRHLLDQGASPASILVLAATGVGAESIRSRLHRSHPAVSGEVWVVTLRSFARDVALRRPRPLQRTSAVRLADRATALRILASAMRARGAPRIETRMRTLGPVLTGIARGMASGRDDADADPNGPSALRARLSSVYEDGLAEADAIDPAALAATAARILRTDPEATQSMRRRFAHILIDDLQAASQPGIAMLAALRELGCRIWATYDRHQAIDDFAGATRETLPEIAGRLTATITTLAVRHRGLAVPRSAVGILTGDRESLPAMAETERGRLTLTSATSPTDEVEALVRRITDLRLGGIPYGDQVVLGRSHNVLRRLTEGLRQAGIPVLRHGDIGGEPLIRTLMAIAALGQPSARAALTRVASEPPYGVSRADIDVALSWMRAHRTSPVVFLDRCREVRGLTLDAKSRFKLLASHLPGPTEDRSPTRLLRSWVFGTRGLAQALLASGSSRDRIDLVHLHHLLVVCAENERAEGDLRTLKERLAHLASLDQETGFGHTAPAPSDLDAVLAMTIHASRHRQFRVVHVGGLSAFGSLPAPTPDAHDDERRLLTVAVSRAVEQIHLSLTTAFGSEAMHPYPALAALSPLLEPEDAPTALRA